MSGFWSGFAKGWEAESERIERRKLFQQELNEKRVATLADLYPKLARARAGVGTGGTGDDATPSTDPASAEHNRQFLLNAGYTPAQIAELNSKGGVYALQAAVDATSKYNKPENPFTDTTRNMVVDSIVVTQAERGEVPSVDEVAEMLGMPDLMANLEPDQRAILDLMETEANQPQAPYVSSTFTGAPEPIRLEEANQATAIVEKTMLTLLAQKKAEAEALVREATDSGVKEQAVMDADRYSKAMEELKAGNTLPAAEIVGIDAIGPLLENNPRFKTNTGVFGPYAHIADAYLQGGQPVPEAKAPKAYTDRAQIEADVNAGLLQDGDIVIFEGKAQPINLVD